MRGRKHTAESCFVEDCLAAPRRRGMCDKHYRRWQRHGDPLLVTYHRGLPDEERFWLHVSRDAECWIWRSEEVRNYGRFKRSDGTRIMAHRYAYELAHGPIPDGLTIDHLCNVPLCVNATHMEVVTIQENIRRRDERRRAA